MINNEVCKNLLELQKKLHLDKLTETKAEENGKRIRLIYHPM